ncbi:MAG: ABC transporter permease [Clostridia bacterium]|nr:ABC transporter permease [Clostridia bacterium]
MLAIYKKEIHSYFTTPLGYIFLAAALVISAIIFSLSTLLSSTADTSGYFQLMIYLMVFFLPILTMRAFSEERRAKTDQLLFTSPVSIFSLILGKFFAAFTMLAIYMSISAINLIPLYIHAGANTPNGAIIIGNMLAMAFVGMCFIAIGIFASSLTENSAASFLITAAILIVLLVINLLNTFIPFEWLRTVLSWLSIYARFINFTYGIFDIGAVIYYLSITFIFLFITERLFQVRRLG